MILDEKVIMRPLLIPPPAYYPSPLPSKLNLSTLPPHILLQILHRTFPQSSRIPDQGTPELQRKTLYWMSTSLRLVNRALYTACMHILRSTYLRAYQALLKLPYSSDPFPITSGPPAYETNGSPTTPYHSHNSITEESPLQTMQRETVILDRFITLKVREDVFSDDSCLHLEGDDKFRDLFTLAQPQARLEDLIRAYGVREGVVSIPGMAPTPTRTRIYTSSLNSSSQSSFQPPNSPFHDSNAATVTYPVYTRTSVPIPQVITTSNVTTTPTNKPSSRSTGFFSTLRKLTYPSSPSSPSPPSPPSPPPQSQSYHTKRLPSPKPIQPLPFSSLSLTFTFQSIKLIHKRKEDGNRICVAQVPRARGRVPGVIAGEGGAGTLEALAEELVRALKEELEERSVGE